MTNAGSRGAWVTRFACDRRGQSETIGVVLLLALTVFGATAVVSLGGDAISGVEQSSEIQRSEHVMTLLDSRGAMAALGDSETQEIALGRTGSGSFTVADDAGWIKIEHLNYTATEPPATPENETLYRSELGAVVYENSGGDRRVSGRRCLAT